MARKTKTTKSTKTDLICEGCKSPINEEDLSFETRAVERNDKLWHRQCHLKTTPAYALMEKLFHCMDDWDKDPTTAMADLIGNLGHFADITTGIDFEEAIRRGLGYWEEERA